MKYFKLKKEIGEKWLKALRSSKYKQGEGFLKQLSEDSEDSDPLEEKKYCHCCLGVLGEVINVKEEFLRGETFPKPNTGFPLEVIDTRFIEILAVMNDGVNPFTVQRVKEEFPKIEITDKSYSFNEIADFIETYTLFY